MIIRKDANGSIGAIRNIMAEMAASDSTRCVMLLCCDDSRYTPEFLDDILTEFPKPVFGGIFPGLIYRKEKMASGFIAVGFSGDADVHVVRDLSDPAVDYDASIDSAFPSPSEHPTMFVFADAFARRIGSLIDSLFTIFGLEINYLGGGCGSLDFLEGGARQHPCLITNEGVLEDAAVLAMVDMHSGIGVSHGWKKISGPYKVTKAHENMILELDWQPAFEVYREAVQRKIDCLFDGKSFFTVAKDFPFGIAKMETDRVVRDPFYVDGTAIAFGTSIPTESFIDILTGDEKSLLEAAVDARDKAMASMQGHDGPKSMLVMDCVSRALYMGDAFQQEVDALNAYDCPLVGALTVGEVANTRNEFLEMYNKTCVVGVVVE